MIVDADVLIAALDPADALHQRAVDLVVDTAGAPLRTPELTLAECLAAPARAAVEDRAMSRLRTLGVQPVHLESYAVDVARLRASTGLKMPDALVLLAAERSGEPLATFDDRLASAARGRGVAVVA